MIVKYLLHILVLVLVVFIGNSGSIILKTQDFNNIQFDPHVAGLPYPQYIKIDEFPTSLTMQIYNMTSQTLTLKYNFTKKFASNCEYALQTVDYGYYTKFPFYRVIADCSNSTHTINYNIKVYRSGDTEFLPGDILAKSTDEISCQQGPLKVQYFYSAIGQPDTFVYRLCLKNQNQTQTQSYYKQFVADGRRPYIFKEDSIQKLTGLTNISLVDMQPALGLGGKYTAFLCRTNGLIINGGSKFVQTIWKIPGNQQPYRLQKLCWSNNLAILTQGYIYFASVSISANSTITVNLTRKTDKININTTSKCNFFTIGHNAVCSIIDNSTTTWYIYSQDKNQIPTNQTEVFKNKTFIPYLSEDLCSTSSFYQDKSKFQLYLKGLNSEQKPQMIKKILVKRPLTLYGQVVNFLDTQSLFVVSLNPINTTHNYIYSVSYTKANFDRTPNIIKTELMNKNMSDVIIQYEIRKDYYNLPILTTIYTDYSTNRTNFQVYLCNNKTAGNFSVYKNFTLQLPISSLGYLQNQGNISQYFYAAKTPLQNDAYARFIFNGNTQLRYPYQFEAISYKACSITSVNNQILFYRQDTSALTVMRVGFRNKNFLALDGVKTFPQYKWFNVQCIHDGLFLFNSAQGKIIKLDNDLQVQNQMNTPFETLKFTKQYVLVKNGAFIQIRSLSTGDVVAANKWSLEDILTNIHSSGFINKKQSQYYQFVSEDLLTKNELKQQ